MHLDVVPYVGTWIEIDEVGDSCDDDSLVVPYVGTWIEIFLEVKEGACDEVVPYVGTWIEMAPKYVSSFGSMSFPTWERG